MKCWGSGWPMPPGHVGHQGAQRSLLPYLGVLQPWRMKVPPALLPSTALGDNVLLSFSIRPLLGTLSGGATRGSREDLVWSSREDLVQSSSYVGRGRGEGCNTFELVREMEKLIGIPKNPLGGNGSPHFPPPTTPSSLPSHATAPAAGAISGARATPSG